MYYIIKITHGVRNDGHFTHKLLMSEMAAGDVNNLAMYFLFFTLSTSMYKRCHQIAIVSDVCWVYSYSALLACFLILASTS